MHPTTITRPSTQHHHRKPHHHQSRHSHPHPISKHNLKLKVLQIRYLFLGNEHQRHINAHTRAHHERGEYEPDEREYREGFGAEEHGEDECDEDETAADGVENEDEKEGLLDCWEDGWGNFDGFGEVVWDCVSELWTETCAGVCDECWLVKKADKSDVSKQLEMRGRYEFYF